MADITGDVDKFLDMEKSNKFSIRKETLFLILCICLFALLVIIAAISGTWPGKDVSAQFFSAISGAIIAAIITLFLLKGQTEVEANRQKDSKVFEEKLRIYQQFLKKLCDVVKDMNITEEEEIELQFQVSYIDMHTEYDSIRDISKQVKEIIRRIRMKDPDRKKILKELLEISDTFHKELYGIKKFDDIVEITEDSPRDATLENFSYIVEDNVLKYEDLKARTRELKNIINNHGALQKINSGTVLFHEYFTTRENKHYVDSKDNIVIDLMPDEDKDQYVFLLYTRQFDPEKTKELVKGIWNEPFNPWSKPHAHVHETIPFKTPDAEIKEKMEEVLQEVIAYRDKEYPLK